MLLLLPAFPHDVGHPRVAEAYDDEEVPILDANEMVDILAADDDDYDDSGP